MQTIARIPQLQAQLSAWRDAGERLALVPTMGNLHAGHARLIEHARTLSERVAVSIFVNPLQFGPNEDYTRYPRTPEDDRALLERLGVDLLYAPDVTDIYPAGLPATSRIEVPGLSDVLDGQYRPGHFTGVATVVAKLLLLLQPQVALFGQKDFQQLAIIRKMVEDLFVPVEIIGRPTVREADGLALSSRNRYLSPAERAIAPALHATLQTARAALRAGTDDAGTIERDGAAQLMAAGFRPDYFTLRDASTLQPAVAGQRDRVLLAAAWLGRARLIDNLRVDD